MKAITIHRPWTDAILHGDKRIENRDWRLPDCFIGQPIALHAGKKYEQEAADWMCLEYGWTPPCLGFSKMGFVGAFIVSNIVTESDDPWFFGKYGWVIDQVMALPEPIPWRGQQKLWNAPQSVEQSIRDVAGANLGWFE